MIRMLVGAGPASECQSVIPRRRAVSCMDEKFLSKTLLAVARRRATERGFASVSAYVDDLILQDLKKQPAVKSVSVPDGKPAARKPQRSESITVVRKRLLDGMFSYMKASADPGFGYACGYTLKHIDRCAAITRDFLETLSALPKGQTAKIIAEVKRVVLKLNKLNESCGGALIETDQREELCQLIQTAANKAGLKADEDITAEWREW